MKKKFVLLQLLISFTLGYLIFTFIVSGVEVIFLSMVGDVTNEVGKIIIRNFKSILVTYIITYLAIFLINLLINYISIKILNKKLEKIKRKGDNYEE